MQSYSYFQLVGMAGGTALICIGAATILVALLHAARNRKVTIRIRKHRRVNYTVSTLGRNY